jgi:hypothetical protein
MAKQRSKSTPKQDDGSVSRRTFLQSAIVASAAAGAVVLPAGAAQAAAAPPAAAAAGSAAAFKVLSEEQGQVLAAVLNRLVPADGEMPAAGDIGIVSFIDGAMADASHLRQPILDVLGAVTVAGPGVLDCDEDMDRLLKRVEQEHKESFTTLLQATYTGSYSHPDVLHAIGWVPPGYEADISESFDEALLAEVRQRGALYRQV